MEKININELTFEELENFIEAIGEKKFHARQIFKWIHREKALDFDKMTDLSPPSREIL